MSNEALTNLDGSDPHALAAPVPEPADAEKLAFSNGKAIDAVHERLVMIETALHAVLVHLDPSGTSSAFDELRALAERKWHSGAA